MGTASQSTGSEDLPLDQSSVSDELASDQEEATDASDSADRLPLDQVFEILKNERRRTVLEYLRTHEGPVALGELAEHVAAVENDKPVAQVTSNERKCVYVGLYQCHLPKMDNMDIVEFNQNRGRIEVGPNAEQLEEYHDPTETAARPWPLYYLGVSGVGLLLSIGAYLSGGFSDATVAIAVAVMLSVAALAIVQRSERTES